MEEKIQEELEDIRKEIDKINRGQTEGSFISFISVCIAFGLAILMYSANQLNEALGVKFQAWVAWLGIIAGVFIILMPAIVWKSAKSSKGKGSR